MKSLEQPLSPVEIRERMASLPNWALSKNGKSIRCDLLMKDFGAAISMIKKIAALAEEMDHHPDIHLTSYRRLGIELTTHSAGGLSNNDFILASKIDETPKKLKVG
jgi:4a-hydroxytetrahydrobiopterin dehydratase